MPCFCKKCGKIATFGFESDMKRICCKYCKTKQMINVDIVKRKKCDCGKNRPYYGFSNDKKPTRCVSCKENGMIDILTKKSRKLWLCHCHPQKRASFGYRNDKRPTCCFRCKKMGMVDIVSKKCKCGKRQPIFGLPTDKKANYCSECKNDSMVNIKTKKCISCGLFISTKKPFLCSYCNPDTKKRHNTSEMKVVEFLKTTEYSSFIHNQSIGFVCGNYRPDILYDCLTHFVVIEIDEQQHRQYEKKCEYSRMLNIEQSLGLPTVFIRYNPHKYIVDGKPKHDKDHQRFPTLLQTLSHEINNIPQKNTKVVYLYYDNVKHNIKHIKYISSDDIIFSA